MATAFQLNLYREAFLRVRVAQADGPDTWLEDEVKRAFRADRLLLLVAALEADRPTFPNGPRHFERLAKALATEARSLRGALAEEAGLARALCLTAAPAHHRGEMVPCAYHRSRAHAALRALREKEVLP